MLPNYVVYCPQCGKQIALYFNWKDPDLMPNHSLGILTCFKIGIPKGCGWSGFVLASTGHPFPEP